MSKKPFKSQASSARAVSGAFGGAQDGAAFGTSFGAVASSPLSYVYEPPDLSRLSEPNIVVAFKNLQKKDATTKAKALEDLQSYVFSLETGKGALEEAILEAWTKVYPRTSVDTSRRVRQLAHTLQGQIVMSCGKRIAKYMPAIVASWLAGQYDNDKSVSRAANESFNRVFGTQEKKSNVWRLYQSSILEYARDVIVKETTYTLSDERTTSPDDASSKYSRVVGAATTVVSIFLDSTPESDLEKSQSLIAEFLNEEKVWKLACHDDSFVRRALYRLLIVALAREKDALNPKLVSANILTSGLHTNQVSSAFDFAKALSVLTVELPNVWTVHYNGRGKKSAQNRLCHFLKKGSQGGPVEFWNHISTTLSNLPPSILLSADAEADKVDADEHRTYSPVLSAIREGLNNKNEPRVNQGAAWHLYLSVAELIQSSLENADDHHQFCRASILPILTQFISPFPGQSQWVISGPQQGSIFIRACSIALLGDPEAFKKTWQSLSVKLIEDIKTSLPEQSKDFARSQDTISTRANQWYQLQASLLRSNVAGSVHPIFEKTVSLEVPSIVSVLRDQNGKPYAAAAALVALIQSAPELVLSQDVIRVTMTAFVNDVLPNILLSPSASHLVRLLQILEDKFDVRQCYEKCKQILANAPESAAKSIALQSFVSSPRLSDTDFLNQVVMNSLRHAKKDDDGASWDLVMAAVSNPMAPQNLTDEVLAGMTEDLTINARSLAGLNGLEKTLKQNEAVVRKFALSTRGSNLVSKLLLLADSPDDTVSQRARSLNSVLERALAANGGSRQAAKSMIDIVNEGLDRAGPESLSVDALVGQARKLLEQTSSSDIPAVAAQLLPGAIQSNAALDLLLKRSPNASLAITNPYGGALYMLPSASMPRTSQEISRDLDGYTPAFRMAQYATKLIKSTEIFDVVAKEVKIAVCKFVAILLQLAGDDLSVCGPFPLWKISDTDQELEIVDIVGEAQVLLKAWLTSSFIAEVQSQLLADTSGHSAASYYRARTYTALSTEISESQGVRVNHGDESDQLKQLYKSPDLFTSAAHLTSASDSKELLRLCNGVLADLTVRKFNENAEDGKVLMEFVLLNCVIYRPEDYVDEVPQQRLVFFVKHVLEQCRNGLLLLPGVGGEIMKALTAVLPKIKEIYGSFWADLLDIVPHVWLGNTNDEDIYGIHSSLKLLSLLKRPDMQQSNDDLLDAWVEKRRLVVEGLVGLMIELQDTPDEAHQPRRIVNELLSRLLSGLSDDVNIKTHDLYPVLASASAALQQLAYQLLHTHIPAAQEQVSVDKALTKDFIAQLPQELLSLILSAPSFGTLAEHNFGRTMVSTLRSYLLSWKLTFDHWQNASYKVQADYIATLKEGTYIQDFLTFALNILITSRTRPIDASKFDIETYTAGDSETPEHETHHLLIHLYYLCLRHLPTLSKEWWRDTASRSLNIATETWTQKYISPLIITSELSTISAWAPTQRTDDQPMTVKTSPSSCEITASIPIDEQTMAIAVRLPPAYPLHRAEVKSIHRVGVVEKKWNSWLINAQGVMNLSSSSGGGGAGEGSALIDGLVAWRKNVSAAMKGQTECAICYSVVSGDRQLPSKRCSTCKNCFHSSCLFRWFKSSNSSSCPLCRNSFNYS
ncbi:hypothetical protein N7G274_004908 [Stereocaulon virgatum]|uniref:E3 ubiquitin-protein ligase listerin n=1 Tax=Stereocaulon virgatum TaxID=373712 RepID=A0ABR4AAG1_9LECA